VLCGLVNCSRAFKTQHEDLILSLVKHEVEIIFIQSSCLTEKLPLSITKGNPLMLCRGIKSCWF
jgi:hypothetical protein